MTPVSEAVERVRAELHVITNWPLTLNRRADLRAILADHARLTEQVRVAREGLVRIRENDPCDPAQPWTVARETLTRMEKNDD